MNELKELGAIRRLRGEVSPPNHEEIATARGALAAKIRPHRSATKRVGSRVTAGRPIGRLRWGLTGAAAAVAVALALPALLPRGRPEAAAADLRRFAAVAGEQPTSPLGPGKFYYLKEEGLDRIIVVGPDGAYTAQFPLVREYWVGTDGSGRLVDTPGRLTWPSQRDKTRGEADGSTLVGPSDRTYGPGQLVGSGLDGGALGTLPAGYTFETLPRDPKALYEVLSSAVDGRESIGTSPESVSLGTFGLFTELLRTPLTPPYLRETLFEATAYIPGITVVPEKTITGIGNGSAVSVVTRWGTARVRLEFLVDPATSELLGYQETQLDRGYWTDADPPFVTTSIAYGSPEVVDSPAQRPLG